jgi:hypothetical protein
MGAATCPTDRLQNGVKATLAMEEEEAGIITVVIHQGTEGTVTITEMMGITTGEVTRGRTFSCSVSGLVSVFVGRFLHASSHISPLCLDPRFRPPGKRSPDFRVPSSTSDRTPTHYRDGLLIRPNPSQFSYNSQMNDKRWAANPQ